MADARIRELREILEEAATLYYNNEGEDSPLTDAEYDALTQELYELDANNSWFSLVGSPASRDDSKKIEHKIPMLSSAKVKNVEDLLKWVEWLELPSVRIVAQPKVDGLSATIAFKSGKLIYIATRGDGTRGQDISHLKPYLQGIVEVIPALDDVEIRGELYLPKDTAYDTEGRPLRNNCVGLVNRKEITAELEYVHFVAYALLDKDEHKSQDERLEMLRQWGFSVVEDRMCYKLSDLLDVAELYLNQLREEWLYETDGLIFLVDDTTLHKSIDQRKVVDRYHHYSMALKPPAQSQESRLEKIEWQLSRQGLNIPVGVFSPVQIGGATITRATLNNVENVENLRLHQGHRILLERANDVIPFVKENLDKERVSAVQLELIPLTCTSCGSQLMRDGLHLRCNNITCPEVLIQAITYWVKKLDMKEIGLQTIRKLYELGKIRYPSDLYRLAAEDLICLDGFGEKRVDNFLAEVRASRKMGVVTFLSILGIPLVGRKALLKLGVTSMQAFRAFNDPTYVIGQNIIKWKEEVHNQKLLADLESVLILEDEEPASTVAEDVVGWVVFTGKGSRPRKELEEIAVANGYGVESAMSAKTTLLVAADTDGGSAKLKKARAKGIQIMRYEDFLLIGRE